MANEEGTWLTGAARARFRELGAPRRFAAGSTLFHEGDGPFEVVMLESGTVKLSKVSRGGNELVIDLREPGAVLGELSAIDGHARSATATAVTDVEATVVAVDRFLEFLDDDADARRSLLAQIVGRLRFADQRQLELVSSDALGRVCARIVESMQRADVDRTAQAVEFDLGLTQTELAQWCGLSREAVVKALHRLRDLGWIATDGARITVHDLAALEARAQH